MGPIYVKRKSLFRVDVEPQYLCNHFFLQSCAYYLVQYICSAVMFHTEQSSVEIHEEVVNLFLIILLLKIFILCNINNMKNL